MLATVIAIKLLDQFLTRFFIQVLGCKVKAYYFCNLSDQTKATLSICLIAMLRGDVQFSVAPVAVSCVIFQRTCQEVCGTVAQIVTIFRKNMRERVTKWLCAREIAEEATGVSVVSLPTTATEQRNTSRVAMRRVCLKCRQMSLSFNSSRFFTHTVF